MSPLSVIIFILFSFFPLPANASEPVHHDLKVTLSPAEHRLSVIDTLTLPDDRGRICLCSARRA